MKAVLITGANRGIGKALAEYYLANDYEVYAGVRRETSMMNYTEHLHYVQINIEDDESIKSAAAQLAEKDVILNILINNAGVSKGSATNNKPELVSDLASLDRKTLDRMMDVNTVSPLMVTKYMLPLMKHDNSFVINISSLRATYYNSANGNGNYGYSASKVALNMMTLCLAHDLPNNISTFAVHPGSVQTDMNPGGSMLPKESAQAIALIVDDWDISNNGKFLNYDGSVLG